MGHTYFTGYPGSSPQYAGSSKGNITSGSVALVIQSLAKGVLSFQCFISMKLNNILKK